MSRVRHYFMVFRDAYLKRNAEAADRKPDTTLVATTADMWVWGYFLSLSQRPFLTLLGTVAVIFLVFNAIYRIVVALVGFFE